MSTSSQKSPVGGWIALILGIAAIGFGIFLLIQIDSAHAVGGAMVSDWRLSAQDRAALAGHIAQTGRTFGMVAWGSIGFGALLSWLGASAVRRSTSQSETPT